MFYAPKEQRNIFRHFEIEKTDLSFQDLHQAFGFSQRSGKGLM